MDDENKEGFRGLEKACPKGNTFFVGVHTLEHVEEKRIAGEAFKVPHLGVAYSAARAVFFVCRTFPIF